MNQCMDKLLAEYEFDTVLDIGCGGGDATRIFRNHNKTVTAVDINPQEDPEVWIGDYRELCFPIPAFDAIWCNHVLEHQVNPGAFLRKIRFELKEGGVLALTVPPAKHEIVGGHVSIWNGGLLLYHLILAGFDCSKARLRKYDYNISVLLKKKTIDLPPLRHDNGDINRLKEFFPCGYTENFDGDISECNWHARV